MKSSTALAITTCVVALAAACSTNRYATTSRPVPVYSSDVISAPPPSTTVSTPPVYVNPNPSNIGPLSDNSLADNVRQQFSRYDNLSAVSPNVQVKAQNGMVTLAGNVPTEQDRQFLEQVAKGTPGVVGINDQLVVTPPLMPTGRPTPPVTSSTPPTTTPTPSTPPPPAPPPVISSTTPPSGTTPTATPGEIFNLHVQGLTQTDRTLAQQILEGLRTDTTLNSLLPKVDINVANGQVTLSGNVQNAQQRQTIASVIQRAAGAGNVQNNLQVQPAP